jgi:murein DD-endopeptidase MepM/ murein hydrolase activator NlpD
VAAPGLGGRIGADARKGPRSRGGRDGAWAPNPKWGAYSTQRLVVAERRLERHGMPERKALDAAFAPFPVGGLAVWSDTWGAPRYAGGYHPHHGQDLLCAEGTPLLAVQPGMVEFGSDPLGGTTIELTLRDGSFWYYAHLDHYAKGLTDGEHVSTGQVIGACGESGDATVPHLHFSYFTASGVARNPMHPLLGWLHRAEHRAGVRPSNGHGVPTPPMAELATPSVMHPRPETTTTSVVWAPATYVVAPGGGFHATAYAAAALLLAPIALFAASRRARSWVIAWSPPETAWPSVPIAWHRTGVRRRHWRGAFLLRCDVAPPEPPHRQREEDGGRLRSRSALSHGGQVDREAEQART